MTASTAHGREEAPSRPWWTDAVIYEIYLRSFADSNGDGVGDLPGITTHLDHLVALGVDALWVTPFFPSPGHDHGYDVSDFTAVDPAFGDLGAFDELVAAAHERGLRVVVDVVPNHTSHEHPWFRASRAAGRDGGGCRDYYLWRDPAPDGGPPNNWLSNFGGPAWTFDPGSGQYYHHSYLPEQPDLNWRNPEVLREWVQILTFWLQRGVDGFRIDVAHNLLKHADFPDNPLAEVAGGQPAPVGRVRAARTLARVHDVDQDDVVDVFRRLRSELPPTTAGQAPLLLGETVLEDADRVRRYIAPDCLDCAMWFGTQAVRFDAEDLARAMRAAEAPASGVLGWFLSNHDRSRPATRLAPPGAQAGAPPVADGRSAAQVGADRALVAAAVVLAMPGPYLLYQGEELGAPDLEVDAEGSRDPIAVRAGEPEMARDRARAPMPWTSAPHRGFSSQAPWLRHAALPPAGSVAEQSGPTSHLQRWRALIAAWRSVRAQLPREVQVTVDGQVLTACRGPLRVVANLGTEPVPVRHHAGRSTAELWRSGAGTAEPEVLGPEEVAWWVLRADDEEETR